MDCETANNTVLRTARKLAAGDGERSTKMTK